MLKALFSYSRSRLVVVFGIGLVVMAVFGLSTKSVGLFGTPPGEDDQNRSLQLVSTTIMEGRVKVSLKNTSAKIINGIVLDINGGAFQIEFLDADDLSRQGLTPGGIYEEWFALQKRTDEVTVTVIAVTFDNLSGEGDAESIKQITDTRLGVKKQLLRFSGVLQKVIRSNDADSPAIFARLKSEVNNLPDEDPEDSLGMKIGQRKAKDQVRHEIERVEKLQAKGTIDIRRELVNLADRQERRMQKLP
jgi:hypothetical protein